MHRELSKSIFDQQTNFCADSHLLEIRKWKVILRDYPILIVEFSRNDGKSVRVKMKCDDWDETPPSIEILDNKGNPLSSEQFPKGHNVLNHSLHPQTCKPFIYTPGSLEYHQHSSHKTDLWENYKSKSGYDLGGILTQVWNAWRLTI